MAAELGIDFRHRNGASDDKMLPETYGSGVAFADLDSDGDLDLYFVNSGDLISGRGTAANGLFLNDGGAFVVGGPEAGAAGGGYGMGVLAGDVDGDSDCDLYATALGADQLYVNDGTGRFTDRAAVAGLAETSWGTSATYLDYDLDGDLDLFVADYVEFSVDDNPWCGRRDLDLRFYCDPRRYRPTVDRLYRNDVDGERPRFEKVSAAAGIVERGNGLGVVSADFDVDGDPDLYVANDMTPNFLYLNAGTGRFVESALLLGAALSGDGAAQAGMGVDTGDFDDDDDPDLLVTNYQLENNALYRNEGDWWTEASFGAGLGEATLAFLGFGAGFFDYDNDGRLDIFVANGHVHDNIEAYDPIVSYAQRPQLFHNDGRAFAEPTEVGPGLLRLYVGRGSSFGDYDADGDVDVAINNNGGMAALLRNDGPRSGHWIRVKLIGGARNTLGVGAEVRVQVGERTITRWAGAGSGYLSTSEPTLHFGLGEANQADRVEVRWPDGATWSVEGVLAGRLLELPEPSPSR